MPTLPMTREEYEARRNIPLEQWTTEQCHEADALIRMETLINFRTWTKQNIPNKDVREYLHTMVRCHFGSVETDELLKAVGAYPDWMYSA